MTPRDPSTLPGALCREVWPDLMEEGGAPAYPYNTDPHEQSWSARPGRAVCALCDLREECLDWALSVPDSITEGMIYGGYSSRTRKNLRTVRNREAAA